MPVSDFSFTFLGTGTSAGVPVITCDCDVCTSDDPKDKRLRCSVCVRFKDEIDQERVVLIDTSPDLRQQVLKEELTRCDAILLPLMVIFLRLSFDAYWAPASVQQVRREVLLDVLRRRLAG